jgi:hypothetical protein
VIRSGQQILLADDAQPFFKKVEFELPEEGDVRRLRPGGLASPVVIDPLVRFGRPSVQGVATERLWELFDAGESIEQIADGYEMPRRRETGRYRLRGAVAVTGGVTERSGQILRRRERLGVRQGTR